MYSESRLKKIEDNIAQIQKALLPPPGTVYGNSYRLVPVYIKTVSQDGTRITVSPIEEDMSKEATVLSPIPTNIEDGRRLMGFPTARTEYLPGDTAICAVIDERWYILGYFNLPNYDTGEKVSSVKENEKLSPFRGGFIIKLSELGQIIARKSNQFRIWLSTWADIDIKGPNPLDIEKEPVYSSKFANYVNRVWGGFLEWRRIKTEGEDPEYWRTYSTDVRTKAHEPEELSDIDLPYNEKNPNIDNPQINTYNLNYADKVIKRSGTIGQDTHVYERETRGSKEGDKEKTQFTRLREGNRDGVLSHYQTLDSLAFTRTSEKLGAMPDGRVMTRLYAQDADADGTDQEFMFEEFGKTESGELYTHAVYDANESSVTVSQTEDGITYTIAGASNIVITALYDGNYTVKADTKVVVDSPLIELGAGATEKVILGDAFKAYFDKHIHATGVGPSAPPTVVMPPTTLSTKNTTQ